MLKRSRKRKSLIPKERLFQSDSITTEKQSHLISVPHICCLETNSTSYMIMTIQLEKTVLWHPGSNIQGPEINAIYKPEAELLGITVDTTALAGQSFL